MNQPVTMHTGPLGSTIHALRADAGTVAELAAVDWNRHYRRVWLTPDDVCEAVEGVRLSGTRDERTEAVARIVRRRQRASVRVREEEAPYPVHSE